MKGKTDAKALSPRVAEAKAKVEQAKAEREKAEKFQAAKNEHLAQLVDLKEAESQDLAHYTAIAEHYCQSDVKEASAAGLLARILRLEVINGLRDEPPKPEEKTAEETEENPTE